MSLGELLQCKTAVQLELQQNGREEGLPDLSCAHQLCSLSCSEITEKECESNRMYYDCMGGRENSTWDSSGIFNVVL